jgi:hypothetical protein
MHRNIPLRVMGPRALGVSALLLGALAAGVGLAGPAVAAEPTPTVTLSVTPPDGEDGGGAPNPITGVTTGSQVLISIGLASQNSDEAAFPAPTGTVTLSDSQGLLTSCEAGPSGSGIDATALDLIPINPQNPLYSVAYCEVTFPAGTTGSDVLTATYAGDENNGPGSGTETLDFAAAPPPSVPETPFAPALPLAALGIGAGVMALRRRQSRKA